MKTFRDPNALPSWAASVMTSVLVSLAGSMAFARASGATWEQSAYVAVGIASITLTIHRFAVLATHAEKK